jgi:hypothetical protein
MIELEARLRESLASAARTQELPSDFDERVSQRVMVVRRRRAGTRAAVAVALIAALGVGLLAIRPGDRAGRIRTASPAVEPGWHPIAPSPLSPRSGALTLAMGDQVLVLGGSDNAAGRSDGAVLDVPQDKWHPVATSPLPNYDAIGAWTGREAIVLSGNENGSVVAAAYDPANDSWRVLAPPPLPNAASATAHAVWTGTEMLVIDSSGGGDSHDFANHAAIYDPRADRWHAMSVPADPFPIFGDAVWTGDRLAVVGRVNQSGSSAGNNTLLVYDAAGDTWHAVAWQLAGVRTNPVVAWTGQELFIGGGGNAYGPPALADAALVDLATGTWTTLPNAPIAFAGNYRFDELWTGTQVLTLDGADTRPVAFDPTTKTWNVGPPSPTGVQRQEAGWAWAPSVQSAVVSGGGTISTSGTGITGCCTPLDDSTRYTP